MHLFVTSQYQWEPDLHPTSIYIYSFIIPKVLHNSYHFYYGWLLSQNFRGLEIQTEIREIYRHKSANVHDIISLTYTLTYVPDVILDRKSLLLWKDINACACTHTHTHTRLNHRICCPGFPHYNCLTIDLVKQNCINLVKLIYNLIIRSSLIIKKVLLRFSLVN